MNIFFTTPYAGKAKYQASIDAIVEEIARHDKVTTPEDTSRYLDSLSKLQKQGLNKNQAHYAFIRQGIASADAVVIEATEEDIRVGHEITLSLLFHKPTLVLAQGKDFSQYIPHDLLRGASYKTNKEAQVLVSTFLKTCRIGRPEATMQTIDMSADSLHSIALAKLRQLSKQEPGQFGTWARAAEKQPQKIAKEIEQKLGNLKKQPDWSVFAPIYNEDSPDYIQAGVAKFIADVLRTNGFKPDNLIVEAACGTAALSRQLVANGITKIKAFDRSRPMLAEAFRLCAGYQTIEIFEADINSLHLPEPAKAIVWTDYSSNFALDKNQLKIALLQLVVNLAKGGVLIFDIRTLTGWQIDFYSQPITTFATERFQRIWLNHQNKKSQLINFDVFIRVRDVDGAWSQWQRESMSEKMWELPKVLEVVKTISEVEVKTVYGDDFRRINPATEQPNLAYIVLRKR